MIRLSFCFALLFGLINITWAEEPPSVQQLEKQIAELKTKLAELKAKQTTVTKKPLTIEAAEEWRSIRDSEFSNNGKWFAHRVVPTEGAGEVMLRDLTTQKEIKFPGGSGVGSLAFSFDSKWFAFTVNPVKPKSRSNATAASTREKPKVVLVQLTTGQKTELEGFSSMQFSGESSTHLALRKAKETGSSGPPSLPPGVTLPPGLVSSRPSTSNSTSGPDLVLRDLATHTELVFGNVEEYSFDKKGTYLVMLIEAEGQIGNGIQLRDMKTGVITALETDKASYSSLNWHDDYTAFTALKAVEDKDYEGKWHSIVGIAQLGTANNKTIYDPKNDPSFPANMGISKNRTPAWTNDLNALSFGIAEQKKKTQPKKETSKTESADKTTSPESKQTSKVTVAPPPGTVTPKPETDAKPDLVIWHWKDERLQPMQQIQANSEKALNYLCLFYPSDKKFVQLGDESCRTVNLTDNSQYAVGIDIKPYEYLSNLDGRRYSDVYTVDLKTGQKTKILTKVRFYFGTSPTGTLILFYEDGHFFVYDLVAKKKVNITASITQTSFVDVEDDHNIDKPPTRPAGWSKDGKQVLLSDDWDLWMVQTDGQGATNLTVNGKKDGIRYGSFRQFEPDRKQPGYDLTKSGFVSLYGEWTKKDGIGLLNPTKPGVKVLLWDDCSFGSLSKARDAEVYGFTKETSLQPTNYFITGPTFDKPTQVSDTNPQQSKYLWSAGVKLVEYKAINGTRLQGALHLPANYEPGKKYPTVVYIYEKLSNTMHRYSPPSTGGFNRSIYTSNGYAVLTPDITYKVNDPGRSSVECLNAALDAVIATGIVDPEKLGLQGHSWGGYQTAYAITQTDRFKAACAGAPLTDLVSMYSSVYWNTGSANQPIFESSQGRFTAGYWDQQEAYIRNSPVYFAKNVKTPLLMLHNDKDGAVDFTQGVEYYNTLRRLQKPVVMLQYKGENHGLAKPENREDYSLRMKEYFDHYLQGQSAPDWWKEGVPYLKLAEHLKSRK